jgi:PiT family inorganic phosphate transporter
MLLLFTVILVALIFDFTNGFHDTANAIATVVGTKVLTPRQAIVLATVTNLVGAMVGSAVAQTIASGLVDAHFIAPDFASPMLICALVAAISWNLLTWYFGLPSSSSHALIGGLVGAAFAAAQNNWRAIIWCKSPAAGQHWWAGSGVLYKVVIPMLISPVLGFVLAFVLMTLLYFMVQNARPLAVARNFGRLQLLSSAYMGFSHGSNDAQKNMGIITLALVAAAAAGTFKGLPDWLGFLKAPERLPGEPQVIPLWVKIACSLAMATGTASGGWRIIKTLGHKLVKLQPIHGFAAETAGATVLLGTAAMGMPVSTTHVITSAIMGVGAAKRLSAVKWDVVKRILWAWVLTLPVCAALGWLTVKCVRIFFT